MTREMRLLVWGLGALVIVGCNGKDDEETDTDGGGETDDTDVADTDDTDTNDTDDTDVDDTDDTDDTDVPSVTERMDVHAFSPTGADALYAVAAHPAGGFVAAGFWAPSTDATADREMLVVRFTDAGDLDTTFGTGGMVHVNMKQDGTNGESARGIAVQSTGHIVVAGAVEADLTAPGVPVADRDIMAFRLMPDGTIDQGFGDRGAAVLDLGEGVEIVDAAGASTWAGVDAFWWLGVGADDKIVIHGATRSPAGGARTDTDFAVVRLTADGDRDATFGDNGLFTLDIEQANASARGGMVLADGSIVLGGYANTPSFGTVQPVLYKVTAAGELDESFADDGLFHDEVLAAAAEIYSITMVGNQIVTAGYGRSSEFDSLDWVSMRFDADGQRDFDWGGSGVVQVDVNGFTDQARHVATLPGDRALIVGAGTITDTFLDGAYGIVNADGTLAGQGPVLHDFGGIADMMWGSVVSNDERAVAIVGVRGVGSTQDAASNDDSTFWLLPL